MAPRASDPRSPPELGAGARLHRQVMRVLLAEIVAGTHKPGDALPTEQELAARFGVSRGVSRETIRGLEERGLISVRHGRGATVNEDARWERFDPDVLEALLASPRSGDVLRDYLECRRILEIEAAGLAAERARPTDRARLGDALERIRECVEGEDGSPALEDAFHEADIAFHEVLIDGTGNRALATLGGRLHRSLLRARYPLARPEYRVQRALPEHERIYLAVAAGDADAARSAMRDHLLTIEGYLREHVDDLRRGADQGRRITA